MLPWHGQGRLLDFGCGAGGFLQRMHCQGWKVTTYGELGDAIKGALANSDSPSVIEVVVAEKSIPSNAEWKCVSDGEAPRPR